MIEEIDNIERREVLLHETHKALRKASHLPYNNAAIAYHKAGLTPDERFGGSCIDKLNYFSKNLPETLKHKTIAISSKVRKTTHYALLVDILGEVHYVDPFLWQKDLMSLDNQDDKVTTLYLNNG